MFLLYKNKKKLLDKEEKAKRILTSLFNTGKKMEICIPKN
jgi:hypothetical protein